MNLEKLRAARAKAVADMRAILDAAKAEDGEEERDLTEEEAKQFADLKAKAEKLAEQIEQAEYLENVEAELETPKPAASQRGAPHIPPGPEAKKEFETLGEFIHAVRFNPNDQRLNYNPDVGVSGEQTMDTGSQGGFAVPTQFRDTMFQVDPQEAAFRPRATIIPAGDPPDAEIQMTALDQTDDNNSAPDNVYGGVTVNWIEEGGTKPETDADLASIIMRPKEVAGHIKVTDKLLRNWPAASGFLETQLRNAVISAEEHAFINGSGVARPLGVIPAGATYDVNRGTATTFKKADLDSMMERFLMRGGNRNSAVWLISQSVMNQLLSMVNPVGSPATGDGALVWKPEVRTAEGLQQLMGIPIIWHERSPSLGTKGDVVLVDLSYYLIKDGSGPFVAMSEHVNFLANKTVVKIFWNVDGQPWLKEPFKQEGGFQVSPFVSLDVPS